MRKVKYPTEQIDIYCADCKQRPNERFCENCDKSKCRICYEENCLILKLTDAQNRMLKFIPDCVDKKQVLGLISGANNPNNPVNNSDYLNANYIDRKHIEEIQYYKDLLNLYELKIMNAENFVLNIQLLFKIKK